MLAFTLAVSAALVFSFLCSIFESVLLSLGHAQVESLKQQGRRSGYLMARFKSDIDIPIAAILIVNTIAHTVGAAVAGATYGDVFDQSTLWVFTIVFTIAVLLFTEIIPKTLGVTFSKHLAGPVAYGIWIFTLVLKPFVMLSSRLSRALRGDNDPNITSAEEIRLLAALGRQEGSVARRTASMITGATQLQQLDAEAVMVPRPRVTVLSMAQDRDDVARIVETTLYSRFPVTGTEDPDEIVGIVLTKELLLHLHRNPSQPIDWQALLREPMIVPETLAADTLLRRFQEVRNHMAIVVDEYGTFTGIVTNEDVLEEIVGEMFDESDRPAKGLMRLSDGAVEAPAQADLRRVCAFLEVPWQPDEPAVSLGGLITELLDRLPKTGDKVAWQGYELEVIRANERRAELVKIRPAPNDD